MGTRVSVVLVGLLAAGCKLGSPAEPTAVDAGVAEAGRARVDASVALDGSHGVDVIQVGDLSIRVVPGTANLSIVAPDGKALLQGIDPSNAVGTPQSQNDDAPPMTGFAVRDLSTAYTMSYGSFKVVDDTTPPWRVVTTARVTGSTVDLLTKDGTRVASLAASKGEDASHLVIDITAGDGAPDASSSPAALKRRILVGLRLRRERRVCWLRRADLGRRRPEGDDPDLAVGGRDRQGPDDRRPRGALVPPRASTLGVHADPEFPLPPAATLLQSQTRHTARRSLSARSETTSREWSSSSPRP